MCEYAVLCRTLLVILETFSKFKNPRAFYRQEELWQLYVKVSARWCIMDARGAGRYRLCHRHGDALRRRVFHLIAAADT